MISSKFTILGSGPAGAAAAVELLVAGQDVSWVAPNIGQPWQQFLGLWLDEARALGLEEHLANRWENVSVRFSPSSKVELNRTYARLDNTSLCEHWLRPFQSHPEFLIEGKAVAIQDESTHVSVTLSDGTEIRSDFVLDARGASTQPAQGRKEALVQSAYGIILRSTSGALSSTSATLMDFSDVSPQWSRPATFLYALPLAPDTFLLEETSLAHAPGLPPSELKTRLWDRLARLGVQGEVVGEEHVHIPMAPPLPPRTAPTVALGAAAALINPMSGYSVPAGIAHARDMVGFLLGGLAENKTPLALRKETWQRTWSPERRLERKIRLFGIDVLTQLNLDDSRSFLETLFRVNPDSWKVLLGHSSQPAELLNAMHKTFRALPFPLQIKASFGISRHLDLLMHLSRYRFVVPRPQSRS